MRARFAARACPSPIAGGPPLCSGPAAMGGVVVGVDLAGSPTTYSPGAYPIELQKQTGGTCLEQRQLVYFVITNHQRFLRDVSKRSGEYLSTVAQLSGVSAGEFPALANALARWLPPCNQM